MLGFAHQSHCPGRVTFLGGEQRTRKSSPVRGFTKRKIKLSPEKNRKFQHTHLSRRGHFPKAPHDRSGDTSKSPYTPSGRNRHGSDFAEQRDGVSRPGRGEIRCSPTPSEVLDAFQVPFTLRPTDFHGERRDPVRKAERAQARKPTPTLSQGQTGRYVPAHVAHQVSLRDRGQCTFTGTHGKCRESRWTDVHHVTPVSRGGTSTLDNLTTLCASHHRYLHAQARQPATHDLRPVPSSAGRMAGNDPL